MLKMLKACLLSVFCLVLASCVTVTQMEEKLAKAAEKTNHIAEMGFTPIEASIEQPIVFDENTPFYDFKQGKSFYRAISLPEPKQPRFLNIKTFLTSSYLPSAAILIPNFLVLDANKKEIAKVENYRLKSEADFWRGGYYLGSVPLPADAAYLVAYAATQHIPEVTSYSGNGKEYILPLSPAGEFLLTLGEPLPMDYDFSRVLIKDSAEVLDIDKVNFYYVKKIESEMVDNSLTNSVMLNRGRGMRIEPRMIDRELSLEKVTLTIAGKLQYATPIQELIHKTYEVEGSITFTPVQDSTYVVKGVLNEAYQAVWIEDEKSHQIMDKKIEVKAE